MQIVFSLLGTILITLRIHDVNSCSCSAYSIKLTPRVLLITWIHHLLRYFAIPMFFEENDVVSQELLCQNLQKQLI